MAAQAAIPAIAAVAVVGALQLPRYQLNLSLTAIVAAAVIAFWVTSFPRCIIMHPVAECSWLGLTVKCLPAIDFDNPWNFQLAHWLLAGALFAIGCANVYAINFRGNYLVTASSAGYALITGAFAIFRAQYGISKPLLIGAAVHNWFEWVFVASITYPTLQRKKAMLTATTLWIMLIILLVALVPDTKVAIIIEQSFGIMLDFFLAMSYLELAILSHDNDVRSFYFWPFIAAGVHLFFTILPLVFANFAVGGSDVFVVLNEIMIYLSPILTHGIYYFWGQEFDRKCNDRGDIENNNYMVTGWKLKMFAAWAIGMIPLVGVSSHTGSCPGQLAITGTTVARVNPGLGEAFIDRVSQFNLVETAKATPGCIDYVLSQNIENPDEFRFIETWETTDAVTAWIERGVPAQLFRNDAIMRQLLLGGKLQVQGAYVKVRKPKEILNGGVAFSMGSPCSKIWKVVGNWSNCSWVIGCKHVQLKDDNTRVLTFANNRQMTVHLDLLNNEDTNLKYSMTGYKGSLTLFNNATTGGCDATYAFHTDGVTFKVDNVYKDFLNVRVPALQDMFKA